MIKIFIDSADLDEIEEANSWGILDGVTTNPSLIKQAVDKMKKKGKKIDMETYIKKMLKVMKGKPVSLEVTGTDYEEMVKEGEILYKKFNKVAKNVVIKIPINPNTANGSDMQGIKAISQLTKKKIPVNCTLIFDPEQAALAAKAGAKYVSPFVGRFDDYLRERNNIKFDRNDYFPAKGINVWGKRVEEDGMFSGVELVKECSDIFRERGMKCEILAASIRNPRQLAEVFLAGADIATVPFNVLSKSVRHVKTKEGMKNFIKDSVREYVELMK